MHSDGPENWGVPSAVRFPLKMVVGRVRLAIRAPRPGADLPIIGKKPAERISLPDDLVMRLAIVDISQSALSFELPAANGAHSVDNSCQKGERPLDHNLAFETRRRLTARRVRTRVLQDEASPSHFLYPPLTGAVSSWPKQAACRGRFRSRALTRPANRVFVIEVARLQPPNQVPGKVIQPMRPRECESPVGTMLDAATGRGAVAAPVVSHIGGRIFLANCGLVEMPRCELTWSSS